MNKNPTPQVIVFFTSLVVTIITALCAVSLKQPILHIAAIAGIVFLSTYILFLYSIELFIYRKIKLIYKNIHNLKSAKGEIQSPIDLRGTDAISDVSKEVLDWANTKKDEIDQLRKLEIYRKEFLGNVSHELKTPLFSIQGYINTILDDNVEDHELMIYFLKKAAKSADRLASLVEDLEAISRLETGELRMEMEIFDVTDLTRDIFDSLEMRAAEKKISLEFKEGCNIPFIVEADKERIRQVLINLITNSLKYGKEGGKTQIGLYDMDENVLIEVSDNGIGIDQIHLPRLFERFYRVDKSRSREEGGTGLGLSIVKHLIEAHQQTINVRSTSGIGSTFGFTLKKAE